MDTEGDNRTLVDAGTEYELGYGSANCETSVTGGTALTYDCRGNVAVRPPLAGGASFLYEWVGYDRLKKASRSGANDGRYLYDAGGSRRGGSGEHRARSVFPFGRRMDVVRRPSGRLPEACGLVRRRRYAGTDPFHAMRRGSASGQS